MVERPELRWESLGHLLEDAAIRHPDRNFVLFEGQNITFERANQRSNQVANALCSLGLVKADRVAVMLPNGIEFPVVWLSIAKAGLTMVPTNTEYQAHDLEYTLADSGARCLVVHADYLSRIEKIKNKLSSLEFVLVVGGKKGDYVSYENLVNGQSTTYAIDGVSEKDIVNIQYTSGTTGFPKGCMLTHRHWMVMGHYAKAGLEVRPDDVHFNAQPFYYGDPQWNIVFCLMVGVPLVLVPRFSVSRFWQTVVDNKVTFFYCLGTMPVMLLSRDPDDLEKNHFVRAVSCSGIPPNLHETIEKRFNCPWREGYGTTESGTDLLESFSNESCVGTGSLGKPIASKQARVVSADGNDVSDGEVGELITRGEPIMVGYWNKPEATADVIRDCWFHSGDLFRKDNKGNYFIVGRIKDMVRRGGENISAAEVESVLVEHPKIQLVAIVPVPDEVRGEEVKAYILLADGETENSVPPQEIIQFAKGRLAAFKVPRFVEYVRAMPMTPSERVEKRKLIDGHADLRTNSYDAESVI